MKNRDLIRILKEYNFVLVRSNGHSIYSNSIKTVAIPNHMEHSKGLIRRIFQQMGLNKEQIQKYI